MLFGVNEAAPVLLTMLKLNVEEIARFRDCYLSEYGSEIIVYTRTGGNNRDDYQESIDKLRAHSAYVRDYDLDFDNTYMEFVFKVPDEYLEDCKRFHENHTAATPSEKFKALFASLKSQLTD